MRSTKAFIIGAGAAYVLSKLMRGGAQRAATHSLRLVGETDLVADDATIEQQIRNDVLPETGVSPREVEIEVEAGVVALRGSVESSKQADELLERVAGVPCVRDVAAMLRVKAA